MYLHNEMSAVDPIYEKIKLLRDFRILGDNATKQEVQVGLILTNCNSDIAMEQKLHNVLHGNETLKELIDKHGGKYMKLASKLNYVVQQFKEIENLEEYAENLKKSGEYDDFETRLAWDCLRMSVPTETVCNWYDKYECTDAHITTLVKTALRKVRGGA